MTGDYILAIDVGSQSVRASLFDRAGNMAAVTRVAAPPPDEPLPGYADVDAADFFDAVQSACRQLRDVAGEAYASVAGFTLTTQRATTVFLDRAAQPVRPAILWSDQRRTRSPPPVGGLMGLAIALIGATDTVNDLRARAPALWMARHEPHHYAASHRIALLSSYLIYRLTDRWIDSSASQVGYLPFHFRRQRWYASRNWRWRALGLKPTHRLVDLAAPGTRLGILSATVNRALGLRVGTPLLAAAADKACEVLGSGCLDQGTTCLSFGTAATVNLVHDRYATVRRFVPAFPAADGQRFLSETQVAEGFVRVSWFLREFGADLRDRARTGKHSAESYLDALLAQTRPSCRDLLAQPVFTNGLHATGPEAHAALSQLIRQQTRASVYRALMESLLLELREALERLERRRSLTAGRVVIAGGGARSDHIMQLAADVLGRPVFQAAAPEASSLGAAMCAAVGLGWYPEFRTAVEHMTGPGQAFSPQPDVQKVYSRLRYAQN